MEQDSSHQHIYDQLQDAQLGDEVDTFLRSNIGKYLLERANEQKQAALEGLVRVNPADAEEIRKLQTEIEVATAAIRWLVEQYRAGRQALRNLELQEQEGRYE